MAIEWNENLATGNYSIDNQHKELFRRFGNLLDACHQKKGKDEVCNLLNYLGIYVRTHFATEEEMQQRHFYPHYLAHKGEHDKFIVDLHRLEQLLTQEGASLALVIQTNQTMISWLINHISVTDKEMAVYLRSCS